MDTPFAHIGDWLDWQLSAGKVAFSKAQLQRAFPGHSAVALKRALNRLSRKGKIVSIHQGYYLIIAPQYSHQGIMPPSLFIDDLMRHLDRSYYLGLLSASARYGAGHQAAQSFYVVTTPPALRPTVKKKIRIHYLIKSHFPTTHLVQQKTETAYIWVSRPELTALDLLRYRKRAGGLNRISGVLIELVESFSRDYINRQLVELAPLTMVQRLGYLLEKVVHAPHYADCLYEACTGIKFQPVYLDASAKGERIVADNRWKVIVNVTLDPDL